MITDLLKTLLANHIESALIVWGYHWNVEGPDFNQYHEFFGEIYSDYFKQVDTLAEYIRIISNATEYVNASIEVTKLNTTVKSNPVVGNNTHEMCSEVYILNTKLIHEFRMLFKSAIEENIQGLANYCADRLDVLNKLNWKLSAIAK